MNVSPETPPPSKAPPSAVRLIAAMLVIFGLVALYANVQRYRRDLHDRVTVTLLSPTPTPTPTPSPAP